MSSEYVVLNGEIINIKELEKKVKAKSCLFCKKVFVKGQNCSKKEWIKKSYCTVKCGNDSRKGKPSWNKGIKRTWESSGDFKKGNVPWNKGKDWKEMQMENSPRWKGLEASLVAKHAWVVRRLGQPKKCVFCGLDDEERMYHWSNISGKYLRDVNDYQRLCVPCHKRYDLDKIKSKKK